jgi:endonuclease/exonuclease/phosphatase family metal-dependent hydrolase
VLGASHTGTGGNKSGWADGSTRMGWAFSVVQSSGADVVGLQEFEVTQFQTLLGQAGGAWDVYPGLSEGKPAVRNSIAWRRDTWELVEAATIPVPYFHGNRIPMPYVRLRNIASGQEVYFINIHNPATTHRWGDNERWRDAATDLEIGLVSQLHSAGFPVVLTGDFNERAEVFCRITGAGTMRAANGGSVGGGCAPPADHGIDWIFGSAVIQFSNYLSTRAGLVQRATDHPFVVADAAIPPLEPLAAGR